MHNSDQMHVASDDRLSRDLEALRSVTENRLPSLSDTERRLHERLRAHSVIRRRMIVAGGIAAVCSTALAAPLVLELSSRKANVPAPNAVSASGAVPVPAAGHLTNAKPSAQTEAARQARAKRDALRREIVRHVSVSAAVTRTAADLRAERQPRPTDLENKMGPGREKLTEYLNDELSPLLAECVEQAEARSPNLAGMFAIGIETLAYEELGAVVDVANPTDRNQLADPLFLECVRESAFTLIIPPPLTNGQEKFEVNGYFGSRPAVEE